MQAFIKDAYELLPIAEKISAVPAASSEQPIMLVPSVTEPGTWKDEQGRAYQLTQCHAVTGLWNGSPTPVAVRDAALEEAADAMMPALRNMLSRGEAADTIRALKSQPPKEVQDALTAAEETIRKLRRDKFDLESKLRRQEPGAVADAPVNATKQRLLDKVTAFEKQIGQSPERVAHTNYALGWRYASRDIQTQFSEFLAQDE